MMEAVTSAKSKTDARSVAVRVVAVIVGLLIGVTRHDCDRWSAAGHSQLAAPREAALAVEPDAAPATDTAANIDPCAGRDGADHRETDARASPQVEGGFGGGPQGGCRAGGEYERRGCGEQC